jgi:hypothetical protein
MCGVAVSSATFSKASRPVETKLKASGVGSGPQPLIASETDEAPRARCSVPPPTAENGGIEYGGLPVGAVIACLCQGPSDQGSLARREPPTPTARHRSRHISRPNSFPESVCPSDR